MPPLETRPVVLHLDAGEEASAPASEIEREQRLSRSILWQRQRRYFDESGVSAWSTATVPHYVTNNPALAHAYAATVLGWLRDLRAGGHDPAEPATIVELGAGSGRFAFLFLKALTGLLGRSPLSGTRIRYVMTDFTETNVRFWRSHPSLQPFIEQGVLDFAVFDAEEDGEIHLLGSGVTLAPHPAGGPLAAIANYVFDGIRQDAFSFAGGQLHEHLVSIRAPGTAPCAAAPEPLDALEISYTPRPAPLDYYGDPALDAILRGYAERLDGATVVFPCAAIRCLSRLAEIGGGRLLLLSGDRGTGCEAALAQSERLGMALHGSFSMEVNYHAIAAWVSARGGRALTHAHLHAHLCVAAFLLGDHPSGYAETRLAYEEAVEGAGPDDLYAVQREARPHVEDMALAPVLALIRLSRWDPRVLATCLPALWKHQPSLSAIEAQEVIRVVTRVWENHYAMGEEHDLAFELGLLLHAYGGHREAIALFEGSARLHGDGAKTRWNAGLCHYALGEVEAALGCFAEAARVEPGFVPVGAVQVKG
jgi:hypothetical protein